MKMKTVSKIVGATLLWGFQVNAQDALDLRTIVSDRDSVGDTVEKGYCDDQHFYERRKIDGSWMCCLSDTCYDEISFKNEIPHGSCPILGARTSRYSVSNYKRETPWGGDCNRNPIPPKSKTATYRTNEFYMCNGGRWQFLCRITDSEDYTVATISEICNPGASSSQTTAIAIDYELFSRTEHEDTCKEKAIPERKNPSPVTNPGANQIQSSFNSDSE